MAQNSDTQLLVQIHDLIRPRFNLEELRDLCYRLGVEYEDLRGETLSARIHALVQYMHRRGRLVDLLNFCAHLRPNIGWPDLSDPVSLDAAPAPFTTPERNPRQIFLSHASQDAVFARRLAADLRRHEWDVWIAPDSIRSGEGWVDAINRGLAKSGVFLLALTPDAVNSKWVRHETNVAIGMEHEDAFRFIPLDVKPAAALPLWTAYQWVSFQSDYKDGLERLLQELQPEKMRQLDGLYQQLQEAVGNREWTQVQKLGSEINALYPNYRETEAAQLYAQLRTAIDMADWVAALTLAEQIETLWPNYRDVKQLAVRARQGRRQDRRDAFVQTLRRVPVGVWVGGIALVLFFGFQLADGGGSGNATVTPTETLPVISQITTETPTASATPQPTDTRPPTNTPTDIPTYIETPEPTNTPTLTITPSPTDPPTATSTPTSTPTLIPAAAPIPTFTLIKPTLNDDPSAGLTEFIWKWPSDLEENQGFEVRVWRGSGSSLGLNISVEDYQRDIIHNVGDNTYSLTVDISNAPGVNNQSDEYNWTVLLVEIDPYKELGIEAAPSRLYFNTGGVILSTPGPDPTLTKPPPP